MSPQSGIQVGSFGPFAKGLVDGGNPSLELTGSFRAMRSFYYSGVGRLSVRPGVSFVSLPVDDVGNPVTMICWIGPFLAEAAIIAYSSVTQKVYLYTVPPDFSAAPTLIAQVWHGMTTAPDVSVCEGLGFLYIAHTIAQDATGVFWPTRYWDGVTIPSAGTDLPALLANGTYSGSPPTLSAGTDLAYFTGVIAFQQALWGWGYGTGNVPSTAFRPELARFSTPQFGILAVEDSITLGNEVRTLRERIIGAGVADESLFLAGTEFISRVTGFGRDSWYKTPLESSYGLVGPKAGVTAGTYWYYWSPRGPMRVNGLSYYQGQPVIPEPLFDQIPNTVASVVNESTIVAIFDSERDSVRWFYDVGQGVRRCCAYDTRREIFVEGDGDFGIPIRCAAVLRPVFASAGAAPTAPAAPPSGLFTSNIGTRGAQANWVNASPLYSTSVEYAPTAGDSEAGTSATQAKYTVSTFLPTGSVGPGQTSASVPGRPGVQYQWRCRHLLNGQFSGYTGPSPATIYTCGNLTVLPAPTNFAVQITAGVQTSPNVFCSWTNQAPNAPTQIVMGPTANGPFVVLQVFDVGISSGSVTVPTTQGQFLAAQSVNTVEGAAFNSAVSNAVGVFVQPGP